MNARLLAAALSLLLFLFVVEMIREERLTFKYAFGWLLAAVIGLLMAVFDRCVVRAAGWFGFELPSNFIFFTGLGVFVFLSLLLTIFLCQQNRRTERLAQKIALLENEVEDLKRN